MLNRSGSAQPPDSLLRLPEELVIKIFLHYRDTSCKLSYVGVYPNWIKPGPAKQWWFVSTAICRRLRNILLATPLFWSLIDIDMFSRPRVVQIALRLSKQAPLNISAYFESLRSRRELPTVLVTDLNQKYVSGLESLEHILKESHRIRILRLEIPWDAFREVVLKEASHRHVIRMKTILMQYLLSFPEPQPHFDDVRSVVSSKQTGVYCCKFLRL